MTRGKRRWFRLGRSVAAGFFVAALARAARAEMDWSGPYVGIDGGRGWGRASTSFNSDGDADGLFGSGGGSPGEPPDGDFDQSLSGGFVGVHAGDNIALGNNFYAGFEAEYGQANIRERADNYLPPVDFPGTNTSAVLRVNSLISLTPQVGLAWDRALFRMKGGIAAGRVSSHLYNSTNNDSVSGPTTFDQAETNIEWTWGVGLDYALTDHWILGLTYDYFDLGTFAFGGVTSPDSNWPLEYFVHPIVRIGGARLTYKFGGERRSPAERDEDSEPAKAYAPPVSSAAPAVSEPPKVSKRTPVPDMSGDPLIVSLKTGDVKSRAEAAIRLGELRRVDAVAPLIEALADAASAVRGAAADALGKIGSGQAVAPLAALFRDPDPRVRALTARALGALGDSQAVPALRKASAHDSNARVRKMAGAALRELTVPGAALDDILRSD